MYLNYRLHDMNSHMILLQFNGSAHNEYSVTACPGASWQENEIYGPEIPLIPVQLDGRKLQT